MVLVPVKKMLMARKESVSGWLFIRLIEVAVGPAARPRRSGADRKD